MKYSKWNFVAFSYDDKNIKSDLIYPLPKFSSSIGKALMIIASKFFVFGKYEPGLDESADGFLIEI